MAIKKIKKEEKVLSAESVPVTEKVKSLSIEKSNGYVLMFQVEGHRTWRANFYATKEAFDVYLGQPGQAKHAKVTAKKWFIINRFDATITEEK